MNEILDRAVNEAVQALGDNLVSVVLYGSHARSDANPRSDFNLLFVVKDYSAEKIAPLRKLTAGWLKKRVVPPVIIQSDQMPRSLDTFALEFVEMAAARKVLFGEDPFANFSPDWSAVRRDLEREARQKRIALTRRWLAASGNAKALRALIADTVPSYFTILRGTVMLTKRQVLALTTDAVFTELSTEAWFRAEIWSRLRAVARGQTKLARAEVETLLADYLQQAISLVRTLDELE